VNTDSLGLVSSAILSILGNFLGSISVWKQAIFSQFSEENEGSYIKIGNDIFPFSKIQYSCTHLNNTSAVFQGKNKKKICRNLELLIFRISRFFLPK